MIGKCEIDLEDRFIGNLGNKQKASYKIQSQIYQRKLRELQKSDNPNPTTAEGEDETTVRSKIGELTGKYDAIKMDKSPVEYKALISPDKSTSQGSVEMFLEILPNELARSYPVAKIEPPKPTEYEIRLVIYETFDIPKSGDVIDLFVQVSFAPDGWSGEETVKRTDVHMGSDDGYGIFNWRMLYPLLIPCPFPRLRFSVYDSNLFSSDESIGEAIISLRRI